VRRNKEYATHQKQKGAPSDKDFGRVDPRARPLQGGDPGTKYRTGPGDRGGAEPRLPAKVAFPIDPEAYFVRDAAAIDSLVDREAA
jgi:hypothetical protein